MRIRHFILVTVFLLMLSLPSKSEWIPCSQGSIPGIKSLWLGNYFTVAITDKEIYWANTTENTKWQKYKLSTSDSVFLKGCKYYKTLNFFQEDEVWIWGKDEKEDRNIIIKIHLFYNRLTWEYISDAGDEITDLTMDLQNNYLYAVGKKGLIIKHSINYKRIFYPESKDLTGIVHSEGNSMLISGNGFLSKIIFNDTLSTEQTLYPDEIFTTLHVKNGKFLAGSNKGLLQVTGSGKMKKRLETDNYSFKPFSGIFFTENLILNTDNGLFVTDYSESDYSYLLPEVDSLDYQFIQMAFNNQPSNHTLWGITNKGHIYINNFYSIKLKPFARIQSNVYCSGEVSNFQPVYYSGGIYKWTIEGNTTVEQYAKGHRFDKPGQYPIKLVITNDFYSDTAETMIKVETKPISSLQILVLDSILCKKEATIIRIKPSHIDKLYSLVNLKNDLFGTSFGIDSQLDLKTNLIDFSDQFKIKIQSSNSLCQTLSDTTFKIRVEETEANFYCDDINVVTNSDVNYFNLSKESTSYIWKFGKDAIIPQSSNTDIVNRYSSIGSKIVTLIATSPAQCIDSLVSKGVEIIDKISSEKKCWDLYIQSPTYKESIYPEYLSDMILLDSNNLLICGQQNMHTLYSNYGKNFTFKDDGGYLANYTSNGTLKWIIKGDGNFVSMTNDDSKNIYLNQNIRNGEILFRGGNKIKTDVNVKDNQYIFYGQRISKMDRNGKFLIAVQVNGGDPEEIVVDKNGNMFLSGIITHILGGDSVQFIGGKDTLTLFKGISPNQNRSKNYVIKTDQNGNYLWSIFIDMNYTNGAGVKEIKVDNEGSLYISGASEHNSVFYSSNPNEQPFMLSNYDLPIYSQKSYLMKYNKFGEFEWILESYTKESSGEFNKIEIDEENNVYIAGRGAKEMVFAKNRVAIATSNLAGYYLAKFNKNGTLNWLVGNKSSFLGRGTAITIKNGKIAISLSYDNNYNDIKGTTVLTSVNNENLTLDYDYNKYYLLYYDTDGNIKGYDSADRTPSAYIDSAPVALTFDNYNSLYYASTSVSNPNYFQNYQYIPFCSEVSPYNDGIWGKVQTKFNSIVSGNDDQIQTIKDETFIVYPNPTSGILRLNIKDSEIIEINVYDSKGVLAARIHSNSSNSILNLNDYNLSSGLYKLIIRTKNMDYNKNIYYYND